MVLGVDEACTNVIRYAYRLRDDQLISLRMEGLRKCVRMRLRDYGEKVFPHEMKGRSHDLIKPGVAKEMRARFPQGLSVFRKGANVDGARRG